MAVLLGLVVGQQTPAYDRIGYEADAGDDVGGAESNLFRLGKVVGRVAIEGHSAERDRRVDLKWDDHRRIQQIDSFVHEGAVVGEELNDQVKLRESASRNVVVEIRTLELRHLSCDLGHLVLYVGAITLLRDEVPFEQSRLSIGIEETVGRDTSGSMVTRCSWDSQVTDNIHDLECSFRPLREEIICGVMGGANC